eukprot:1066737-Ditylum_brightwellii.AAC.1
MSNIRDAWSEVAIWKDCKICFQWKTKDFNNINWSASGRIFKGGDFYHKRFITRYTYKRLPLWGAKYTARENQQCPCCEESQEIMTHFMDCKENKEAWSGLESTLRGIFNDYGIDPVLHILIYSGVTNQNIKEVITKHPNIKWEKYNKLVQQQSGIGWRHIRYGRFSKEWTIMQDKYSKAMQQKNKKEATTTVARNSHQYHHNFRQNKVGFLKWETTA